MSTITCPNCDGTFRSKKDLTGKKVRCPRCDSSFVVEDDAEQFVLPRTAAATPPRAAPPKSRPAAKPQSRKPARGKKRTSASGGGGFPKPLLICLGIALVIGAGWYGLQVLNKGGLAAVGVEGGGQGDGPAVEAGGTGGGLAGMLGLTDTPDSLMKDYTDIGKELQQVLARVTDDASVEPAVEAMEGIVWDLVDLRRRAALAPQVSRQELYKVLRKYSDDEQSKAANVVRVVEQPPGQAARFDKIRQALEELKFLARSTQGEIRQGLEELPEPRNEFEEIEYERAVLLRQAMQQVLQVEDSGGVAVAASAVKETAGRLQALAERKSDVSGVPSRGPQAASKYVQWTVGPYELMNEHVQILENKSVAVEPLSSSLGDLRTANSNIDFANLPGALSGRGDTAQNTGDPRHPPGHGPMAGPGHPAGGRPGPRGGGFGGPPSTKTGPVGPGEIMVILKGDVFTDLPEDPKEQIEFRQRAFRVLQAADEAFRQETGIVGAQARISQGVVWIRGPYDGDPQALAGKFRFGSVDSVDAAARQIEVTVSPALVEKVRASMQQDR